ncbi:MAG: hypothetical protein R2867_42955 [Caldilineaceae bacterium]
MGAVLNIEIPDNTLTRSFDAKLRKTSLEALLIDCLQAMARRSPLLIVLEDCHWLDPLSQDLLEAIGNAIADVSASCLPTVHWNKRSCAASLATPPAPLYRDSVGAIDADGNNAICQQQTGTAIRSGDSGTVAGDPSRHQADGNPFYIEELINYLHARAIDFSDSAALERWTCRTVCNGSCWLGSAE